MEAQRREPRWHIGFVGFAYPEWNGTFYPAGLPARDRLVFVAKRVTAVEINTTFYAIPDVVNMRRWADSTPRDFRFAMKMIRDVTHGPTPADALASAAGPPPGHFREARVRELALRLLVASAALGPRLGAVLLQFPPAFKADRREELVEFLASLPRNAPLAVEFRHASWHTEEVRSAVTALGVAIAATDDAPAIRAAAAPRSESPQNAIVPSGRFLYVRWLGRHGQFPDRTRERIDPTARIAWWLERLRAVAGGAAAASPGIEDVYIFLDNDFAGHAPTTARRVCEMIGLSPCGVRAEEAAPRTLFDGPLT